MHQSAENMYLANRESNVFLKSNFSFALKMFVNLYFNKWCHLHSNSVFSIFISLRNIFLNAINILNSTICNTNS